MSALVWDGAEVATAGALFDAAAKAARDGKAVEFLAAYRESNPHADENLCYVFGYAEPASLRRSLYAAYDLTHPIFGGA